jgi:mono/diheme cytochrome c family protein
MCRGLRFDLMRHILIVSALCALLACSDKKPPQADQPAAMSPEAAEGKELFLANNCNGCHGETGHGDGPAGHTLNPPPRNFRDIYAYRKGHTQDQVAAMLEFGLEGSPMKGYPLNLEKRKKIAAFVVYLQTQP